MKTWDGFIDWETIPSIIKNGKWERFLRYLSKRLLELSYINRLIVQGEMLTQLGLEQFQILDTDLSEIMHDLPSDGDISTLKRALRTSLIPLLQRQIEQGGPTHFIDIDDIVKDEGAELLAPILQSRQREDEHLYVLRRMRKVEDKTQTLYDLTPLYFTAHGYELVLQLAKSGLIQQRTGLQVEEAVFHQIRDILAPRGIKICIHDMLQPLATTFSETMMYYLLDLNWEITLNEDFVNPFFETYKQKYIE
ncbi:MAG: hypothetical protein BAJATHORv1_160001 [Candidatus Thorarchaeota archaeon]|nr:MAG: hypothetical protein BAJATHORv1_160001 [Candidatus Thorarchaeota archaeon]